MTFCGNRRMHSRNYRPVRTAAVPTLLGSLALRLFRAWVGAVLLLCWLSIPSGQTAEVVAPPASLADVPITTNIHHQVEYCPLCHQMGYNGPIPSQRLFGDEYQVGCRCHYRTRGDMRHPTDVVVPDTMRPKIPAALPLRDGRITCNSCHSLAALCATNQPPPSSLRGTPYPDRTTFCFRCHDEQQYVRLNPHQQLDADGRVVTEKCLFCHTQKPDRARATFASIKLIGALEMLCQGCHNIGDRHPAGKPHLVRPPLEYQVRMHNLEREYGIVLPLDEAGRLTCITCHNPHESGVIPKDLAGAKGASEKFRQRLPRVLCVECHWHPRSRENR